MSEQYTGSKLKIFALNSNKPLAEKIAESVGVPLGKTSVDRFSDGEIRINIEESIRGDEIFIIQSTSAPVNDNLMELLIMIDALRRASAATINVVIPYYGYARQDRKARSREPITAKLVADMIEKAGADRAIMLDLHAAQIQGFFDIPVDHLMGAPLLADYFLTNGLDKDAVVVSPDHGGVTRARKLAEFLKSPIAIIDKRRPRANVAEIMNIIGSVDGKRCVLIDDMIDTAGSCSEGAKALLAKGAKSVRIACTHGIFSGPASKRLLEGDLFQEIVTTDSIPLKEEMKNPKVTVLSLAPMLAKIIEHVEMGLPLTYVYDMFTNKI